MDVQLSCGRAEIFAGIEKSLSPVICPWETNSVSRQRNHSRTSARTFRDWYVVHSAFLYPFSLTVFWHSVPEDIMNILIWRYEYYKDELLASRSILRCYCEVDAHDTVSAVKKLSGSTNIKRRIRISLRLLGIGDIEPRVRQVLTERTQSSFLSSCSFYS